MPFAHSPLDRRGFLRASAVGALALAGALAGCSGSSGNDGAARSASSQGSAGEFEQVSNTIFVFDTVVTLTASCSQETLNAACKRCEYFESIFSRTIDGSDIGRINAAGGEPVEVAEETADIITKALSYCEESDGLFDITIGAVTSLWDFKEGIVPKKAKLAEAIKHVDFRCVQVDGTTVTLTDPDAKLDLGGIAKGYVADDLARFFADAGCTSACINLGGNVKTVGAKPDGTPWRVGIQDPNDVDGQVVAALDSQGTSVVTSGLYERQFTKGGKRYWHILDPKTGYPVQTDLLSASIVSQDSIDGDAYATTLFMLGHDAALEWFADHEGFEGMTVDEDGTITQSAGCDATLL